MFRKIRWSMFCAAVLMVCAGTAMAEDVPPQHPVEGAESAETAVQAVEAGMAAEAPAMEAGELTADDTAAMPGDANTPAHGQREAEPVPAAEAEASAGTSGGTVGEDASQEGTEDADTLAGAAQAGPAGLEPLFVREFSGTERGHNDSNPIWSPSGEMLAFERATGEKKEIIIARPDGTVLHTVYYKKSDEGGGGGFDLLLPGILEEASYNSGMSWSPDNGRFVFMSNGGTGNYDIYLSGLGGHNTTRLTEGREKDGHVHWSPVSEQLVFVSGRTGKADVYLMDLSTMGVSRLTQGEKSFLYPQWSPDGRKVAMMHGSNENHDVYLIGDVTMPSETLRPLTRWRYDDLRPTWSPDGTKIAFYSNYNIYNDPKEWALVVVSADGSDPLEGEGLAARVVAAEVIPDVERGPAWMPDSRRIVYVKNDRHAYNPIHVVDITDRTDFPLLTGSRMNHDVVCAPDGTIAFRAQVEQWDHIYISRLKE